MKRKGIVLAGGTGSRLWPATKVVSKQLMAVYDKPMIYYPLSTLMLAGIRELLLISTPGALPQFRALLGDGAAWGLDIQYAEQPRPDGIAQALTIAEDFLAGAPSALILGDNIFYGDNLGRRLREANARGSGASVFACHVTDPERYGVVRFDKNMQATEIEEKPDKPHSNYAVTGLYFFDECAPEMAAELKPSARGELEITDLNRRYMQAGSLAVEVLGRGYAWLDTGTHDSLLDAAAFIATLQKRQGLMVACLEEIAFRQGWIDRATVTAAAQPLAKTYYGQYLMRLLEQTGQ